MWLIPKSYSSDLHQWSDLNWSCYWNFQWNQYLRQQNLQNCCLFVLVRKVRGGGTQADILSSSQPCHKIPCVTLLIHSTAVSKNSCHQSWQCTNAFKCFRQIRILYAHYLPFSNLKTTKKKSFLCPVSSTRDYNCMLLSLPAFPSVTAKLW